MSERGNDTKTWFAIVFGDRWGFSMDAYPEERARTLREYRRHIVGEFATKAECSQTVTATLRARMAKRREAARARRARAREADKARWK
jgi:hypothetical protein